MGWKWCQVSGVAKITSDERFVFTDTSDAAACDWFMLIFVFLKESFLYAYCRKQMSKQLSLNEWKQQFETKVNKHIQRDEVKAFLTSKVERRKFLQWFVEKYCKKYTLGTYSDEDDDENECYFSRCLTCLIRLGSSAKEQSFQNSKQEGNSTQNMNQKQLAVLLAKEIKGRGVVLEPVMHTIRDRQCFRVSMLCETNIVYYSPVFQEEGDCKFVIVE